MHEGENYQDFVKFGEWGVFLGHSLIVIKWNLKGFFPKICILTPHPLQLCTKEYIYSMDHWGIMVDECLLYGGLLT